MPTNRLAALAAVLLVLLLALPSTGVGAGGKYKGTTTQNRPVTFKISKGKVRNFKAGVNLFCIGSGIEFNAAIPPRPMKIRKGGKFSYKGDDKSDSAEIVVKGKVSGAKVKGRVSMTHSKYDAGSRMFVGCSGEAKFTAKKR